MKISLDLPSFPIIAIKGSRAMLCRTLRDDTAYLWSNNGSLETPRCTLQGFLRYHAHVDSPV